jgi:hypothetical protein
MFQPSFDHAYPPHHVFLAICKVHKSQDQAWKHMIYLQELLFWSFF